MHGLYFECCKKTSLIPEFYDDEDYDEDDDKGEHEREFSSHYKQSFSVKPKIMSNPDEKEPKNKCACWRSWFCLTKN